LGDKVEGVLGHFVAQRVSGAKSQKKREKQDIKFELRNTFVTKNKKN